MMAGKNQAALAVCAQTIVIFLFKRSTKQCIFKMGVLTTRVIIRFLSIPQVG